MKRRYYVSEKAATAFLFGMIALAVIGIAVVDRLDENTPVKGFWEIGFIEPECEVCLDFFIANSQASGLFSYEIISGNDALFSGEEEVLFGEVEEIAITEEMIFVQNEGRYRIEVRDDSGELREISRRKKD
jgi:hypothetical protein